jgi:RNA exonuclease 1
MAGAVTQYSGITASMMEPVTKTLADVHTFLLTTLPSNAILAGHSLEYDLHALKLWHGRVVDTSLLFPSPRGPLCKQSLRQLAATYLSRAIQLVHKQGHNSVEDARAALDLVHVRLELPRAFFSPQTIL